jgi:serine phosphatase RsbU (regulator of sigma subunit)
MSGHFISAIFCKVNLITGVMVSANAGHLPLLLLRKNGNSEFILSRGRIINELFPPNPVEITTKLDSGDKIVLYTDGITEAKNPQNEMFGEDRLKDVCEANASLEPIKICNAIFDTIHKFTNNQNLHYDDDITILIMEYSGANQNGNSV